MAAQAYDRYMGEWSRLLAPAFIGFAGVRTGHRTLDVGAGTGSLTAALVARLGAEAVVAVEPSGSFVEALRERLPGVTVDRASAELLPYADGAFDAALAQLVVHFMAAPSDGLAEMARVTRPGGIVAACVWDYAGGRGPLGPFWDAARELDPSIEDEARVPGTRRGDLPALLAGAGLGEVEETSLEAVRPYDGFDAWWEPFTEGVGPGGAYVTRLDPRQRAQLREQCRRILPAGPFTLTAAAWVARGVV